MEIVIRAAIVYVVLWALLRTMGKRTLAELGAFELVLLVVIGDIVQQSVTQEDMSVTGGLLAVGTMALMVLVTGSMTRRSARANHVLEGDPVVVLKDGEPMVDVLRREQMSLDDLAEAARQDGHLRFDELQWAVLEADGKVSFIPRSG
jgi:uncharacterized membrane protein YcaP (DUF421 family)